MKRTHYVYMCKKKHEVISAFSLDLFKHRFSTNGFLYILAAVAAYQIDPISSKHSSCSSPLVKLSAG
ncbi:hypothetical protein CCP2SC5_220024 [Azospirillaceae bacterium]